jgi:hypothetical protein
VPLYLPEYEPIEDFVAIKAADSADVPVTTQTPNAATEELVSTELSNPGDVDVDVKVVTSTTTLITNGSLATTDKSSPQDEVTPEPVAPGHSSPLIDTDINYSPLPDSDTEENEALVHAGSCDFDDESTVYDEETQAIVKTTDPVATEALDVAAETMAPTTPGESVDQVRPLVPCIVTTDSSDIPDTNTDSSVDTDVGSAIEMSTSTPSIHIDVASSLPTDSILGPNTEVDEKKSNPGSMDLPSVEEAKAGAAAAIDRHEAAARRIAEVECMSRAGPRVRAGSVFSSAVGPVFAPGYGYGYIPTALPGPVPGTRHGYKPAYGYPSSVYVSAPAHAPAHAHGSPPRPGRSSWPGHGTRYNGVASAVPAWASLPAHVHGPSGVDLQPEPEPSLEPVFASVPSFGSPLPPDAEPPWDPRPFPR